MKTRSIIAKRNFTTSISVTGTQQTTPRIAAAAFYAPIPSSSSNVPYTRYTVLFPDPSDRVLSNCATRTTPSKATEISAFPPSLQEFQLPLEGQHTKDVSQSSILDYTFVGCSGNEITHDLILSYGIREICKFRKPMSHDFFNSAVLTPSLLEIRALLLIKAVSMPLSRYIPLANWNLLFRAMSRAQDIWRKAMLERRESQVLYVLP